MNIEIAFVIIKPDAIERGLVGRIISQFEDTYYKITAFYSRQKTIAWAAQHYHEHCDKDYFENLCKFMTMCELHSFCVTGIGAIARCRKITGETCSWKAEPGTIRGDFGSHPAMYNCVHVSDSIESSERERALFYDSETDEKGEDDANSKLQS
jgi:nucleoside-diphosphate kinase